MIGLLETIFIGYYCVTWNHTIRIGSANFLLTARQGSLPEKGIKNKKNVFIQFIDVRYFLKGNFPFGNFQCLF